LWRQLLNMLCNTLLQSLLAVRYYNHIDTKLTD
jgi:hypothetical protein